MGFVGEIYCLDFFLLGVWLTFVTSRSWDEGLLDMCIGDKRKLTIPPEFGYGQRAMGAIPAGSTLGKPLYSKALLKQLMMGDSLRDGTDGYPGCGKG